MSITTGILQCVISGLTTGSIYALVAVGFTMIYRTTDIINFSQGEFVMLGGMISAWAVSRAGLPLGLGVGMAVALGGAAGALVHTAAVRPVRSSGVAPLIIVTIGASIILKAAAAMIWGKDALPLRPFSGTEILAVGPVTIPSQSLWIMGAAAAAMLATAAWLRFTITGKRMRACAQSRLGAKVCGINIERMGLVAFCWSGALAGLAGCLSAPIYYAG